MPTTAAFKSSNFLALTLNNITTHLEEHHINIIFEWRTCGKQYKRKHPAQCHIPKCTGPSSPKGKKENRQKCSECGEGFKTKSGLSQHQRHRHSAVRNMTRAAETALGEQAPKDGKIFKNDEIQQMLELEMRF
ncbi:hypothetical protein M0802_014069 [Mischocyttarus mexicanus]|nr:hypothetical protein M0802_014069 [Mischocyttarus mexicanus]